ncbi:MAG: putative phage abortive infection protein [Bacteroides sp.]|nr:putative phage abortive infection protein [Bacteroides sp.]
MANLLDGTVFLDQIKGSEGVFALISLVLLFITLNKQIKSYRIDKFENKFFEMLKLHRENVAEFKLGGMANREIFIALIREFKLVFQFINSQSSICGDNEFQKQRNALVASYLILFFGIRSDNNSTLKNMLPSYLNTDIDLLFTNLKSYGDEYSKENNKDKFYYTYYDGHQSRLGHYYRHLFQMVDYVNNCSFLSDKQRYEYVKTLRAQLSNYEQALFFLNSLTPLGIIWWHNKRKKKKGYILIYKLVKNIPQDFFKDNEINFDFVSYFKDENKYFEWEDYCMSEE